MARSDAWLGRRGFIASTAAVASGCHPMARGTKHPDVGRFLAELNSVLDALPQMTPFSDTAAPGESTADLASADASLQRIMKTLVTSGNYLDLETEQRADRRVVEVAKKHREDANRACIEALWEAEDILDDPDDEFLASLDADPGEVLAATEILDQAAEQAGFPKRWRRRLHKTSEELAWRIQRQSARSVLQEAVDGAHRLLERGGADQGDPLALLIGDTEPVMETAFASLDLGPATDAPPTVQAPTPPTLPEAQPGTTPVESPGPAPAPSPQPAPAAPAPAAEAQVSPTQAPAIETPGSAAPQTPPPAAAAPAPSLLEEQPSSDPRVSPQTDISLLADYPGYVVAIKTRAGSVFRGVFAGFSGSRVVLLQNAYKRFKIPFYSIAAFRVEDYQPSTLDAAHGSAMAMTIAGAIMVPLGLGGAVFTIGISLFLFCPGIVILIVGIVRLRQTRRGYLKMRGKRL